MRICFFCESYGRFFLGGWEDIGGLIFVGAFLSFETWSGLDDFKRHSWSILFLRLGSL